MKSSAFTLRFMLQHGIIESKFYLGDRRTVIVSVGVYSVEVKAE